MGILLRYYTLYWEILAEKRPQLRELRGILFANSAGVGSFTSHRAMNIEGCETGPTVYLP